MLAIVFASAIAVAQVTPETTPAPNGTTTNGSPTVGPVQEGDIPTTNPTKTTNATQNGSPLEHTPGTPLNVYRPPITRAVPTVAQPVIRCSPMTRPTVQMQPTIARRDMLRNNPNGHRWLDKFNRRPRCC